MLSPLLFIIVMEALSSEFRVVLPWGLFYADDLCLLAETEEDFMVKMKHWKEGMELKGLRVNRGKQMLYVVTLDLGKGKILGSGHVECVEKEFKQTQQSVQSTSNRSTGNAVDCQEV